MEPDRISLLNVARCLIEDRPFESDVVLPLPSSKFIEITDVLKPLLLALSRGELEAKGVFSRIRLDYPELDDCIKDAQLTQLSTEFRQNEQIILGIGEESHPTDIQPAAWWFEGAIWEKSVLWVSSREQFDEQRWRRLKIQPTVASTPERPYEFGEPICFHEVTLSLDAVVRWADAHKVPPSKKTTHNERNAGRRSFEDWGAIEARLQQEIEGGREWRDWFDVWDDVVGMMKVVNPNVTNSQPYKKLENHLRRNNEALLKQMQSRIKASRSYEPRSTDSMD
ncbi:hypothetical protein [Leisingera aquaemixtae]|uniref:hypothetical protein n=1 Tax=Leisingera aquaemixtae TaxID=1396826 RepID=UPI0021A3D86B|nr:hypothetical protein [Leisingera aquaemixtae]UWQ46870.1 hypothetical protein K3719_05770 [Leisingera aquaemixtae]